tara:strand:+ start:74 stop:703 length:630 start_codon:yes stop_codon:yes gene_type:complete
MARRRAQAVKRPTAPRGPRGSQASSKSPRARAMASNSSRRRAMARMSPRQRAAMVRSNNARARGPQSKATSRPTVNPGQGLRNFMDTMPRVGGPQVSRGPMSGTQLANQNAMQRKMEAALGSQAGKRGSLFGAMGNVPQRPIPNRDGRFGKGMQQSNYMRQQMSPQQSQNAMGRGPMPRANIGSVQAPQLNFNKLINQSPRGRRGRITP